jgi:hypothetical protein
VVEIRSRLAKTLPSSSKSDSEMLPREIEQSLLTNTESVSKFVAALLDEYDALNRVCQQISVALAPLVSF